ncbi:MAG: cob(I)yrinic acid a,c-diamide adenosyltransferase [bacterium]|nr:cob(I)yrinic acid a,c-diamide adenosyltransferase [bacterium]
MGLFYTGKGDKGESIINSLNPNDPLEPAKKKILVKDSVISEALGNLDELNSLIGLIRHQGVSSDFVMALQDVQEALFIVQANVANALFCIPGEAKSLEDEKNKAPSLGSGKVTTIENLIDKLEAEVNPARSFVVPGGVPSAGWLDFARAICRRAERSVVTFSKKYELAPEILSYMNRLSSLLFAMARAEVKRSGKSEKFPRYDRPFA